MWTRCVCVFFALVPVLAAPALTDVTFHVLALPHTVVHERFSACAFTMKVHRMCSMLAELGLHAVLYANEGSDETTECAEFAPIFTEAERVSLYGDDSAWRDKGAFFEFNDETAKAKYVERTVAALRQRGGRRSVDVLLVSFGYMHREIAAQVGIVAVETGIGYNGSWATYRVYESYTWAAAMTASTAVDHYHAVIPNCYYAREFASVGAPPSADDYLAFVGRVISSKGVWIAIAMLRHLPASVRLHVAGQGDLEFFLRNAEDVRDRVVYHGVLAPAARNALLAGAAALVAPTLFKEPFGGVMVEAQMLGTPVITTDHAAMSETVWHGVTGFRCRSLRCFVGAADAVHRLDRERIRRRAALTYGCERVKYAYEDYFRDVLNLWDVRGWALLGDGVGHTLEQRHFYPDEPVCSAVSPRESTHHTRRRRAPMLQRRGRTYDFRNIEDETLGNTDYRRVVYTVPGGLQLVLMALQPGERVPAEIHADTSQFIRIESGTAVARVGEHGGEELMRDGDTLIVPPGTAHELRVVGENTVHLYTLYSRPEHADGLVQRRQPGVFFL